MRPENFEPRPEVGTREAAVLSCVSLLSCVFEQPEERTAYFLDLYYQVRQAYERENASAAAARAAELKASAERIIKRLREEIKIPEDGGPMRASAPTEKNEAADAGRPLSVTAASGGDSSPQGASQENAEGGEEKTQPEPLRENRVKRPSQNGNTHAKDAAVFKREVRDWLLELREKGVTLDAIAAAGLGTGYTAGDVLSILEGRVLGITVYRAIAAALEKVEVDGKGESREHEDD